MRKKKLGIEAQKERSEIYREWKRGKSLNELSSKFGMHRNHVRHILREKDPEYSGRVIAKVDTESILRYWNQGLAIADIMLRTAHTWSSVRRILLLNKIDPTEKRRSIHSEKTRQRRYERAVEIRRLYKGGLSYREIGEMYGFSATRAQQIGTDRIVEEMRR